MSEQQNKKPEVFLLAGGTGIGYTDTIKNKIPTEELLEFYTEDKEKDNLEKTLTDKAYSVWGYSGKGDGITKGNLVFITKDSAAIYMGTVCAVVSSDKFNGKYWGNDLGWKNQIILENVIRIFIPYDSSESREFSDFIEEHNLDIEKFKQIEKLYNNRKEFLYIINKKREKEVYSIQGVNSVTENYDNVIKNFKEYCILCNYECLIKEI